jgi:ABC-2 type transport system ATP-binding protein
MPSFSVVQAGSGAIGHNIGTPMISVRDVHKRFGSFHAVRGVGFEISAGQVVGLLGPNGAGKSTTVRMIAGLLPPSEGSVAVDGFDSVAASMSVRRRLGYLPENTPLYSEMPVGAYLGYRASLFGLPRSRRRRAVDEVIERCWLKEVRRRRIGTLSKGYRQRTGLAAALVHDPRVLLLDEPTSGLDPAQVVETRRLIRELSGNRTVIIVSHQLPEVERTCDRVIVMARGRVQADGSPATLVASQSGSSVACVVEVRISPEAARLTLSAVPGVERVDVHVLPDGWCSCRVTPTAGAGDLREALARALGAAGVPLRELHAQTPSLEEFYIRLIERAEAGDSSGVAA